jgi:hypothetical protein
LLRIGDHRGDEVGPAPPPNRGEVRADLTSLAVQTVAAKAWKHISKERFSLPFSKPAEGRGRLGERDRGE